MLSIFLRVSATSMASAPFLFSKCINRNDFFLCSDVGYLKIQVVEARSRDHPDVCATRC